MLSWYSTHLVIFLSLHPTINENTCLGCLSASKAEYPCLTAFCADACLVEACYLLLLQAGHHLFNKAFQSATGLRQHIVQRALADWLPQKIWQWLCCALIGDQLVGHVVAHKCARVRAIYAEPIWQSFYQTLDDWSGRWPFWNGQFQG